VKTGNIKLKDWKHTKDIEYVIEYVNQVAETQRWENVRTRNRLHEDRKGRNKNLKTEIMRMWKATDMRTDWKCKD
jgi:hypothetical protein